MTTGHPDWQTWAGRSVGGEDLITEGFQVTIASDGNDSVDLSTPPAGYNYIFQSFTVSCPDDTAVHEIYVTDSTAADVFFYGSFVSNGTWDFPGYEMPAEHLPKIYIYNNSTSGLTFKGFVSYVKRKV